MRARVRGRRAEWSESQMDVLCCWFVLRFWRPPRHVISHVAYVYPFSACRPRSLHRRPQHNEPATTRCLQLSCTPSMQCVAAVVSSGATAAVRPKLQQRGRRASTTNRAVASIVASVVRPSSSSASGGTGARRRNAGSVTSRAALPAGRRPRDVRARAEWDDDDLDKNGRPKNPNEVEAGP